MLTHDELVERLAQSMHEVAEASLFAQGIPVRDGLNVPWQELPEWARQTGRHEARAALTTIREAVGGSKVLLAGVIGLEIVAAQAKQTDLAGPWRTTAALLRALAGEAGR